MRSAVRRSVAEDRIDYRALWLAGLRVGRDGQRLDGSATWKLDGLWSAACYQLRAEEMERLLASQLERARRGEVLDHAVRFADGRTVDPIGALRDEIANLWREAHESYRENACKASRYARPVRNRQ
jgi:hypothetical protein